MILDVVKGKGKTGASVRWSRDGKLQREDGPAAVFANGTQFWFRDGVPHRSDGPAVVHANGRNQWWLHGEPLHREEDYVNPEE